MRTESVPAAATTLSTGDAKWIVLATVATVLAAGILIIVGRRNLGQKDDTSLSLIRSWIAISLVAGLLLFCGASFALSDKTLRSTLFGGLVASVGAAVAFYFASKDSGQARQDILDAAFGTLAVPDLVGKTITDAQVLMSGLGLELQIDPAGAQGKVRDQSPAAGASVRKGTVVVVHTG
jgi:uncharacterized membrane protein